MTIRELAETVIQVVGFQGTMTFDTTRLDGTPQKLLDVSKMKTHGWQAKTTLQDGIAKAYQDFLTTQP